MRWFLLGVMTVSFASATALPAELYKNSSHPKVDAFSKENCEPNCVKRIGLWFWLLLYPSVNFACAISCASI